MNILNSVFFSFFRDDIKTDDNNTTEIVDIEAKDIGRYITPIISISTTKVMPSRRIVQWMLVSEIQEKGDILLPSPRILLASRNTLKVG